MTPRPRRGRVPRVVVLALVLVLPVLFLLLTEQRAIEVGGGAASARPPAAGDARGPGTTAPRETTAASLVRPAPLAPPFDGCPAIGRGGDPALNRIKNRVDSAAWTPMPFARVLALGWPRAVEGRRRAQWPAAARAEVATLEGMPVSVEGYVAWARESGPETTNCGRKDDEGVDWHVWLTERPGGRDDRDSSLIVEPTPAIRDRHPGWTLAKLRATGMTATRVRVSGWLMLDPEHPDQVGRTRGTIWEIHPVLAIEVRRGDRWIPLDDVAPGDLRYDATRSGQRRR